MLQKIAPVLPALDISATNVFFRNRLKFSTINYGNYLVVKKDKIEFHYYQWQGEGKFVPASCYIFDDNIEDLFAKFSSMDIMNPKGNLRNNAWGKKEFQILDNNGNVLKFGS